MNFSAFPFAVNAISGVDTVDWPQDYVYNLDEDTDA